MLNLYSSYLKFKILRSVGMVIILLALVSGGLYWAYVNGKLQNTPLEKPIAKILEKQFVDQDKVNVLTQSSLGQTKILTDRAEEVREHAQNVLGSSVQINEDKQKPIHERTWDYAKYLYCQEVVESYEEEQARLQTQETAVEAEKNE